MNYILITPIKDEAANIIKLKESIINQTYKPILWVIGDGNSKDGSYEMCKEQFKEYNWVHIIKQSKFDKEGYSHINFAYGFNECLEYAKKTCEIEKKTYLYIGKVDATPILDKNYFKVLREEMKNNSNLAFVCGLQHLHNNNSKLTLNQLKGIPNTGINDQRLYRKDFLEEMGGYPLTYSPDVVLQLKALNRGFKIKLTNNTYFIESRLGGSKIGIWNGYKLKGEAMHYLGYHPFLVFLNGLYFSYKFKPHYQGLAVYYGYILSALKKENRINDKEVIEYFWKKRINEIINIKHFSNR